jgi:miniconductance mechanosensitive channel
VINLLLPFLILGPNARRSLDLIDKALSVYLIVVGLLVVNATLNTALDIYRTFELSKTVPLTGVVQGIKVVAFGLAGLFIVAALLGLPPAFLMWPVIVLTVGLGFVFRDPILGFVAGIELAADNLVAIGDWIEVPGAEASGHVLEISLVAVKVQNWDNTITMIPTYELVSNPFTNWRGMFEGGGRRFKRPVYIDTNTIKFCTEGMLEAFSRLDYVSEYVKMGKEELAEYGVALGDDDAGLADRRGFTNLRVFRA